MGNVFIAEDKREAPPFKMACIGDVVGHTARLVFAGERVQSQKCYKALAHVALITGTRAVCARMDHTYVIIGIL